MDKISENEHDPLGNATATTAAAVSADKDGMDMSVPDDTHHGYSPAHTHLKTYTAGEDNSRLANAAKELGLSMQQARQPRKQVRQRLNRKSSNSSDLLHATQQVVQHLFLDTSTEDARMRAIYSAHAAERERPFSYEEGDEGGTGGLFRTSLPEYQMTTVLEDGGEGGEGGAVDAHGVEVGGDIISACTGIIKGMVGPAILYLPHGFASAGYIVALPIMLVSTSLFLYSSKCLLDAWKLESTKMNETGEGDGLLYDAAESGGGAGGGGTMPNNNKNRRHQPPKQPKVVRQMLSYPELAYRALGSRGESAVKVGIALMQSGVCLTYLIFVPQNLHTSVLTLSNGYFNIPATYWLVLMVALQVPLSWIRDIRKLTPTNAVANALILYGLITCLGFALQQATTPETVVDAVAAAAAAATTTENSEPVQVVGPLGELGKHLAALAPYNKDWFLFIGTSVLMFEGSITLLVPLQEAVHSEQEREAFPRVYRKVIVGIICFYAFFGMSCWMAFGNDVQTVLTTSLPANALATTVQLAYSVAVVFTFPLQNFPALEIATRSISSVLAPGQKAGRHFYTRRNVISSILVALLAVAAVLTMDSLDKVVSLMGSLLGCPIAFVFPPLIHSQLEPNLSVGRRWGNRITACLGVVAMVLASTTTLLTWN